MTRKSPLPVLWTHEHKFELAREWSGMLCTDVNEYLPSIDSVWEPFRLRDGYGLTLVGVLVRHGLGPGHRSWSRWCGGY